MVIVDHVGQEARGKNEKKLTEDGNEEAKGAGKALKDAIDGEDEEHCCQGVEKFRTVGNSERLECFCEILVHRIENGVSVIEKSVHHRINM